MLRHTSSCLCQPCFKPAVARTCALTRLLAGAKKGRSRPSFSRVPYPPFLFLFLATLPATPPDSPTADSGAASSPHLWRSSSRFQAVTSPQLGNLFSQHPQPPGMESGQRKQAAEGTQRLRGVGEHADEGDRCLGMRFHSKRRIMSQVGVLRRYQRDIAGRKSHATAKTRYITPHIHRTQTIPPIIHDGMPQMTTSSTHSIHTDKRQQSRSSCAHWMQSDSQCKSRLTTSLLRRRDIDADADGVRLDITHGIMPRVIRNGHPSGFMVAVAVGRADVDLELNGRGRPVQKLREDGTEVFDRLLEVQ
jgi:hypothetical protein